MAAGDPGVLQRNYSAIAVETTLTASISASSQGASGTIIVGSVAGFPSSTPYTLVLEPDTSREEVVTVTATSGTTLTVTRGGDNTQALAHSAGVSVRHAVSARDFKEEKTHAAARGYDIDQTILDSVGQTHVHGLQTGDGVVVGTSKTQTLTNKTFSGGAFTGSITATGAELQNVTLAGTPVITGLSSAGMVASSATPKSYVDSILGSATAASTSAASAATSATSAATSATSAAASATTAANSASAAATSATSAAASATAAATSASSAATSASAAGTSATAAATSATSAAASASAASTSASSAATSASNALTSANSAATSATSAANSASAAATSAASAAAATSAAAASATAAATSASSASTSASSAALSATAAATSATSAAASATAAATSAASAAAATSAAAASASAAATSATSAASSATAAAASYDSFDDRYLGAKNTPPSVDNDGNPLITGALYWDTTANAMYVWTGSAWGGISSTAAIYRYRFVATGGETSISGPDANGVTLSYLIGKEQVYLNGILLVRTVDYVATNGSSISSLAALAANDVMEIITFTAFDLATAIPVTIFDAKGDLIVGTSADTAGKLTVGTDGYYLSADSSTATGLRWSAVTTDPNPSIFMLMGA